jgi:hypothetical protein
LYEKFFWETKNLESWFNPQATKAEEDYDYEREIMLDQVNLELLFAEYVNEPTTYEEAINCERKEDQIKWKDAIDK